MDESECAELYIKHKIPLTPRHSLQAVGDGWQMTNLEELVVPGMHFDGIN